MLCNKSLHGVTHQENIKRLYARQHELDALDRSALFCKPLTTRLSQPLSILTTWLSVVQPAFHEALPAVRELPLDDDYWESQQCGLL